MLKNTQCMKRRAMRVDKGLDADVESYRKEVHASSWSDASRQLIVKGLTAYKREKRELKYA